MSDPPESHVPVMVAEVLSYLEPRPGGRYVDCTVGSGGHAAAILRASSPDGRLLGLDADPEAIEVARHTLAEFGDRVTLVQSNFEQVADVASRTGFLDVQGVLLDLGISSRQLGASGRGFAFRLSEPLDMRLDPSAGDTAADLLNYESEQEIERILRDYGEERRARRIASSIVWRRQRRPLATTDDLVGAVLSAVGGRHARIHPATRAFQAIRIAVNRELEVLERALAQAADLLAVGGRLVVISFHSLEDRIVKRFFVERAKNAEPPVLETLTRKPVTPTPAERATNPRSRSAKLRAALRSA